MPEDKKPLFLVLGGPSVQPRAVPYHHGRPWMGTPGSPVGPPPRSARSLEDKGGAWWWWWGLVLRPLSFPAFGAPQLHPVHVSDSGLLVWGPQDTGPVPLPVVRGLRAESPPVCSAHTHTRELSRLLLASGAWAPGNTPVWHSWHGCAVPGA